MLFYTITDRRQLAAGLDEQVEKLTELATAWAIDGIDYIQIREKDLSASNLAWLAVRVAQAVRQTGAATKILINSSLEKIPEIRDSSADGIHLAGSVTAIQMRQARQLFPDSEPVISVSCHSIHEIQIAREAGATLALFAPVFEKPIPGAQSLPGIGLAALAEACHAAGRPSPHPPLPVFALGGITRENATQAIAAGAAGIAGIRLFLGGEWQALRPPRLTIGRE